MKRIALTVGLFLISDMAWATELSALDFLVDGKSLAGQHVQIKDCTIIGAMDSIVMCNVRRQGNLIGNIILDGDTLDRNDLRRALLHCSGMRPQKACQADIGGHVALLRDGTSVRVRDAGIYWRNPAPAE